MVVPGNEKFCHYGCWGPKVRKSYGAPSSQGHSKGALFLFTIWCCCEMLWMKLNMKWHGVKSYVLEWLEIMMWCGISDFIWYVRLICINISTALSTLMLSRCIFVFLENSLAGQASRCQWHRQPGGSQSPVVQWMRWRYTHPVGLSIVIPEVSLASDVRCP